MALVIHRRRLAALLVCCVVALLVSGAFLLFSARSVRSTSPAAGTFDAAHWVERVREAGSIKAYREFASSIQNLSFTVQHREAHEFGHVLYLTVGLDGFAACDSQFSSGCYHELVGNALATLGMNAAAMLDQKCIDALGETGATPCQHGIGHGLMAYFGYTLDGLRQSLAICQSLPSWDKTRGCYGGVFMEYNFYTMEGINGHVRPQTADVYDPCDKLDFAYQPSCYFWVTQWWRDALLSPQHLPTKELARQCTDYQLARQNPACAPWLNTYPKAYKLMGERCVALKNPIFVRACVSGIGYEVLPSTDYDEEAAAQLCADASSDPGYRGICDFYSGGENRSPPSDHF